MDTVALARQLGRSHVGRATPEQVRAATGQAIGGVAPLGHPQRVETVVDVALADYPRVWAAGGKVVRYAVTLRLKGRLGDAEIDGTTTRTVEVSEVGSTKVDVPEAARKALE